MGTDQPQKEPAKEEKKEDVKLDFEGFVKTVDRFLELTKDEFQDFEKVTTNAKAALTTFGKLDKNADGFLKTEEIDLAENDPLISSKLSQDERTFWKSVRKHQYQIEQFSKDTNGEKWFATEGNGVTRADLQVIATNAATSRADIAKGNSIRNLDFSKLDANRDEVVTSAELGRAYSDPSLPQATKDIVRGLQNASLPGYFGFSRSDLYDHARKFDGHQWTTRMMAQDFPALQKPYKDK